MRTYPAFTIQLHILFRHHGGYLTSQQLRQAGVPLKVVQRLIERGEAQAVQRGVYHLLAAGLPSHADLLEVQLRVPYARPTLITALDLHRLTTTRLPAVQVAIPNNRAFPRLSHPPVQVYWYPPEVYAYGLTHWTEQGAVLTVYTAEKTLADLLRLERRLGRDVYLEGLKNYLQRPDRNLPLLLEAAGVNGVQTVLRRDLEVLTHEANT